MTEIFLITWILLVTPTVENQRADKGTARIAAFEDADACKIVREMFLDKFKGTKFQNQWKMECVRVGKES